METIKKQKIIRAAFVFILSALFALSALSNAFSINRVAKAATLSFDETNVLDDLKSSSDINGVSFNLYNYPYNEKGSPQIINFVEWCYSFRSNQQGSYGLYVYIYNPSGLNIYTASAQNKIQLATGYDGNGKPAAYSKFELVFLSASTGNYAGLFYKFRVYFSEVERAALLGRLNSNERRYDVSGVELVEQGKQNAVEYKAGARYLFRGYVSGFGPDIDADSTLEVEVRDIDVVEVRDLRNTFFQSNTSSLGAGHQNVLNSVYFSIDTAFLKKYGRLQKIETEWWEYKTVPMVVTNHKPFYDGVYPYRGQAITSLNNEIGWRLSYGSAGIYSEWGWNANFNSPLPNAVSYRIPFLFPAFSMPEQGVPSPNVGDYVVSSDRVKNEIYNYNLSYEKGYAYRNISADLFMDAVDSGRTRGYNLRNFDADDVNGRWNLMSYDSNHSWWQKFLEFGFWAPPTSGDFVGVAPITVIKDSDVSGTESDVAARLVIDKSEVSKFRAFRQKEKDAGRTTVLFHFAHTDYYSRMATIWERGTDIFGLPHWYQIFNQAYVAQQTVFLVFDMITFTFNKDGEYLVMPVVNSPIDVITSVTPPLDREWRLWGTGGCQSIIDGLWLLLILAVVVILIIVFVANIGLSAIFRFIGWIFKALWRLITAPFKAVFNLIIRGGK